jgi:hypothetical protein
MMFPQEGSIGGVPAPRNDRSASTIIAEARAVQRSAADAVSPGRHRPGQNGG